MDTTNSNNPLYLADDPTVVISLLAVAANALSGECEAISAQCAELDDHLIALTPMQCLVSAEYSLNMQGRSLGAREFNVNWTCVRP